MAEHKLAPEVIVEQLKALREQIEEVAPMAADRRRILRDGVRMSDEIMKKLFSTIGASETLAQSVGWPAEDVRALYDKANRWKQVEYELASLLNGVHGANLIRQNQLRVIATRAYMIAKQLAKDPVHSMLLPFLEEIQRLKSYTRRKGKKEPAEEMAVTDVP
jgi:hypothetical protein